MVASIKQQLNRKGFTLIEMTLYVAICSILLFSISTMFSFLLESKVKSQAITEVNQQGFFVMHMLTSTIRNGNSVIIPAIGGNASTLSIGVHSSELNPTVFYVSSSTLVTTQGVGLPVPITNSRVSVTSLLFENISSASSTDKIIRISYTLSYRSGSPRQEYSYSKVFSGSATLRQ